jgi:hypothetical protein
VGMLRVGVLRVVIPRRAVARQAWSGWRPCGWPCWRRPSCCGGPAIADVHPATSLLANKGRSLPVASAGFCQAAAWSMREDQAAASRFNRSTDIIPINLERETRAFHQAVRQQQRELEPSTCRRMLTSSGAAGRGSFVHIALQVLQSVIALHLERSPSAIPARSDRWLRLPMP